MKLLLHIVRKDAARIRWLWLAWIVVLVAKVGVGLAFEFVGMTFRSKLDLGSCVLIQGGLVTADVIMTYLLAAWLVMEDAPMRPDHYARTRPLSRGDLLAAKSLGALLLLGLAPVLVWLPWWIYSGFGWAACLREAVVTVAVQGVIVLPAFLIASIVDSFRRVLLWTPVWIGALMITIPVPLLWIVAMREGAGGPRDDLDLLGLWQSRFLLAGAILVAGAATLVVWQFLRRRPREAIVGAAACLGATMAATLTAPWNFWPNAGEWAQIRPKDAEGIEVRLESATLVPYPRKDDGWRLSLHWTANTGSDTEIIPCRTLDRIRWDEIQGTDFRTYNHYPDNELERAQLLERVDFGTLPAGPTDEKAEACRQTRLRDQPWYEGGFTWDLHGFSRLMEIHRHPAPFTDLRLHSRMLLSQVKYKVQRLVPLTETRFRADGDRLVRVREVTLDANSPWISALDRRPALLITRPWFALFAPAAAKRAEEDKSSDGLALIDTWDRTVVERSWFGQHGIVIGGVALRPFVSGIGRVVAIRNGKSELAPFSEETLRGLRLVAVERRETARFYREVTVDPLPITAADESPRQQ